MTMTSPRDQSTRPISLDIPAMHCGNCVARVARALTSVEGVEVQSLTIGKAELLLDESRASEHEVLAAVSKAGYPATASG
jgi:copper chaperone CopZ